MKKILGMFLLLAVSLRFILLGKYFWRGDFKSVDEVCSIWGNRKFDSNEFRIGNEALRAQMSCDLLRIQKKFVGKNVT